MDKKLKAKWVKALRSGRYKQAEGFLRNEGKYCCLGVLCNVVAPRKWSGDRHDGEATCFPSARILTLCGVSEDSGEKDHPFWPLAYMNDDGKSFAEIADYIEAKL